MPSRGEPPSDAVGVARSVPIVARNVAAYALLVSWAMGTRTKAGSASFALRSMKARWYAEPSRCAQRVLPKAGSASNPSRIFNVSVIVTPPDDDGGMVSRV